uniref:Decapping nuclease n=1 Tax=Romanomermis culicivorax TaxID=13658 RepID=A0A915JGP1_ROMCU
MPKLDDLDLKNPCKIINIGQLDDVSAEDFLLSNGGVQNLRNYEQIASYNWLGTPIEPQLVIPGAPKTLSDWRALRGRRLQRDSTGLIVDENHLMNGQFPMEALFRCVKLQMKDEADVYVSENPLTENFRFQNFDVVTDRNNLRKLFDFVKQNFSKLNKMTDGNPEPNGTKISLPFRNVVSVSFRSVPPKWQQQRSRSIRINVQVLGNLVCLIRCEEADIESGRNSITYGKDFEIQVTKSVNDFSSGSFRQIVAYSLGGLNFLVRFEVDAADYAESRPVAVRKVDKKGTSDDDEEQQALDVLLGKMSLKTEKPMKIPSSRLSVLRSGEKYDYHLVEVTSRRSNADFPKHVWPQMYFSGTESLIIGWQFYGKIGKIERLSIKIDAMQVRTSQKDVEEEYGGYPIKHMAQFHSLLTQIVEFARQKCIHPKKLLAVVWKREFESNLHIYEVENPEGFAVPESLGDYIAEN